MALKNIIVQIVQTYYGYEVQSSLKDLEEYYMEGKIPTRMMSQQTDNNTRDTDKIGLDMIYKAEIVNYIRISIESKKNLRKSYTVIWDFCKKNLQNSINMNVKYETKNTRQSH